MKTPKAVYVAISLDTNQVLDCDTNKAELKDRVNGYNNNFKILRYVPAK